MFMADAKKKPVTVILDAMSGKSQAPEEEKEKLEVEPVDAVEQDNSIAQEAAAEEAMSALASKDSKAFVSAIKSLMELCREDY